MSHRIYGDMVNDNFGKLSLPITYLIFTYKNNYETTINNSNNKMMYSVAICAVGERNVNWCSDFAQ